MEIGLTGHPLTPTLPKERPTPLFHLLRRLDGSPDGDTLEHLKWVVASLEFLERYFAGFASGLARKLEDTSEHEALAQNAHTSAGVRRLLRYSYNRLSHYPEEQAAQDIEGCFFLHGKHSLPYSHTRWLGLLGAPDEDRQAWDHAAFLDSAAHPDNADEIDAEYRNLYEILQSWLEGSVAFFEAYDEFGGLDEEGWHCTLKRGSTFVDLVPPIPARLIPAEAQSTIPRHQMDSVEAEIAVPEIPTDSSWSEQPDQQVEEPWPAESQEVSDSPQPDEAEESAQEVSDSPWPEEAEESAQDVSDSPWPEEAEESAQDVSDSPWPEEAEESTQDVSDSPWPEEAEERAQEISDSPWPEEAEESVQEASDSPAETAHQDSDSPWPEEPEATAPSAEEDAESAQTAVEEVAESEQTESPEEGTELAGSESAEWPEESEASEEEVSWPGESGEPVAQTPEKTELESDWPEADLESPGPWPVPPDEDDSPTPWPGESGEGESPWGGTDSSSSDQEEQSWYDSHFDVDPDYVDAWTSSSEDHESEGEHEPWVVEKSVEEAPAPVSREDDLSVHWSAAELKSFQSSLTQLYPRLDLERVPRDYLNSLSRFFSAVKSGYILMEGRQGIGKSLLCQAFQDHLTDSGLDATPLIFSVKNRFYPDPDTFLEQLNEHLRIRPGRGRRSFEALHPKVIKNLNLRTPSEDPSQRFAAFLAELSLVNGTRIVLILDGLDEGTLPESQQGDTLFSYLPTTPPDDVYIIVTYHPDRCRPEDKERLQEIRQGPSTDLRLDAEDSNYRDLMERFLNQSSEGPLSEAEQEMLFEHSGGRLGTARHMLDGLRCQLFEGPEDLPPANKFYGALFDRLYERVPDRYLDLFLLLATSDEPVSGDELSHLGISRTDVLELLHSLPSLFHCHQHRNLGLNLAHRSIRLHLQRTFLASYSQSCAKLAKRALRRLSETEVTILPVREDLERLGESVRRLLRWSIDSQDAELLADVCRHELVNKLRRRIFAAMEERTLYHRKVLILDTFSQALRLLVEDSGEEEFREELAWSVSSRALSYYHLGNYKRAKVDIEAAIAEFKVLVEDHGKVELKNGLAAAYNRRSEIFRGLAQWDQALPDANLAVSTYQEVVESGRADLKPLLMLALHNRSLIHRSLKNSDEALYDAEQALSGYLTLVERENRRPLRPQLAAAYQTRAALALDRGNTQQALTSASSALELYEVLVHQENFEDLRNDLASVYNDRGAILFRANILDEAERDYASAISIRTYLVAEGRIDVRRELAKTYSNRGLCLMPRGEFGSALESFDRAVEILDRLIEEERREDLYADRAFALSCRGSLSRHKGDLDSAREDYGAAAGDYRLAVVSQGDVHLEGLAHALNSEAEVCLQAGDVAMARRSTERVLEIYERNLSNERRQTLTRERAIAHHNYGETLRREGDDGAAEREFKQSAELLTYLVEQEGQPQLTGELATCLLRYAQLPQHSAEERLKTVSRALAFFKAAEEEDDRLANLTDEALLLRAGAFRELKSLGPALDDVSRVVQRLEDTPWNEANLGGRLVTALVERATLFAALQDAEAAGLDLDRAWKVLGELESVLGNAEMELRRSHVILERIQLVAGESTVDFEKAVELLGELDERLADVPLRHLAAHDYKALKVRTAETFKNLRFAALEPTRAGDHQKAARRLTKLMDLSSAFRPATKELLVSAFDDDDFGQVVRLRTQRAWANIKCGNLEQALEDFQSTVDVLPAIAEDTNPDTLEFIAEVESGRGAVLDSLGQPEQALEAYSRAVEAFNRRPESALSPRRAACLTNRARLLHRLKCYEDALEDVEAAVEIARSNYQRKELMDRWTLKATLLRKLERHGESLATLREALIYGQQQGCLEPSVELGMRLGVFRLSKDTLERSESLSLSLRLIQERMLSNPRSWKNDAIRLFQELPYPEDSEVGADLEQQILSAAGVLLTVMPVGHTPLIETLLRRAAKLSAMTQQKRTFDRVASGFYCLATKFCLLEYQKYGRSSLERLLRCYLLAGRSLVDSSEAPAELEGLGEGVQALVQEVTLTPPQGQLEVEVNNMARLWLSLPPSRVLAAGISRAALQTLRRW